MAVRRPATRPAAQPKKKGGVAVVAVAGAAAVGGVVWWLLSRRRGGTGLPQPADPVVNVGNDQAVTLDATSQGEIVITFSVVADNPVNLTWTRTSGPGPVNFSPLGLNQEIVGFTVPGNYLIRLTAIDTTDSRAEGFDELVVTVNEAPMEAILVTGELRVDGFATYVLTKAQGQTISFEWPVTNVGSLAGAAFIRLTEGGVDVGTGAAFPIDPGQTAILNFNPVVSLASGVHILTATVMEGIPPTGVPVGSAQIITLTVVSVPVLAAVGNPTINGVVGASSVTLRRGTLLSVSWAVRNDGGGPGQARLKTLSAPFAVGISVTGALNTVPGFTTVTLLLGLSTSGLIGGGFNYNIVVTMLDGSNVVLGTWPFSLIVLT
jgi:hypothetical protein